MLKKNKVKHIYARAIDDVHKTVLEAFSLDRILTPEKEAAGYGINELQLEKEFDLKIISLIRGKKAQNCIGISILEREVANEFPEDYIIQPEDALVCYGLYANFMKFWKSIR